MSFDFNSVKPLIEVINFKETFWEKVYQEREKEFGNLPKKNVQGLGNAFRKVAGTFLETLAEEPEIQQQIQQAHQQKIPENQIARDLLDSFAQFLQEALYSSK